MIRKRGYSDLLKAPTAGLVRIGEIALGSAPRALGRMSLSEFDRIEATREEAETLVLYGHPDKTPQ